MMTPSLLLALALTGVVPVAAPQESPAPPPCVADARWLQDSPTTIGPTGEQPLTLFTAVGRGGADCSAWIVFSAVYLDAGGGLVCSGTLDLRVPQAGPVRYTALAVRPGNPYEFVRWLNGPNSASQPWMRFACLTLDGQTEAQPADIERARTIRLHATVLPAHGGLAVAEMRLPIWGPPPAPPR
ncbi:MAG: hypothetical protein ABS36_13595 [Acidobacteria bacterium SCN 69-37]|nr:MAG: hypothetical protein ABS36_13595 [Acidobacteria bacterium SCN 69-37]